MNKKTGHISFSASVYIYYITGKRGEKIMMEPSRGKWKTPSRAFWRFFGQIAGSLGVFFLVLSIFQSTTPSSLQWQQFLRESFTADADLAPVMQFFSDFSMDSLTDEAAISVNTVAHSVQETMAVPVSGRVLNAYGWDNTQLSARFQDGLWIAAEPEEGIRAAYSGTVTDVQREGDNYTIEISHANGLVTIYGYCAQCNVQLNEPVQKGQIIGNTQQQAEEGNFYFAARYLGEPVNPLDLLNGQAADPS